MSFIIDVLPTVERIVTALGVIAALIKTFHVSRQVRDSDKTMVEVKMHINSRMDQMLELVRSQAEAQGRLIRRKEERVEAAEAVALVNKTAADTTSTT